jgi:nicotinamidase/pyrazinamidase
MSHPIALIIVDMMKVYFYPQTEKLAAAKNMYTVTQNIKTLLDECHTREIPVVYSNDAFCPAEAATEPHFKIMGVHGVKGDPLSEVIDIIAPIKSDFVVEKRIYDGFFETRLDTVLRSLKVDTVMVTGTWTNGCVQHTVWGAFARSYHPIVVADAVTCPDENEHNYALKYMERFYTAKLVTLSEALSILKNYSRPI